MALNCRSHCRSGMLTNHRHCPPWQGTPLSFYCTKRSPLVPAHRPRSMPDGQPCHVDQHTLDRSPAAADLVLTTAAAAAALLLYSAACQPVHAATEAQTEDWPLLNSALQKEEARYDENLMTRELKVFLQYLEKKGNRATSDDLQIERLKLNFRREASGRISLRARDGYWYNVKVDTQTPGFLLLRAERDGSMYFLPPDDAGQLLQIDLSDDMVVAELFASGAWYDVMDPLKVESAPGQVEALKLSEADFRFTSSLLDGAEEESQ